MAIFSGRSRLFPGLAVATALSTLVVVSSSSSHAGKLEDVAKSLIEIEGEAENLGQGLKRPKTMGKEQSADLVNRRLVDAEINFGVGNYDEASVMLYDFVEKYPNHRSWDEALYYLAESLFQKGDYVAARGYFVRLAKERGNRSKFFQQALERLIELTIKLDDSSEVDTWLAALDQVPQQQLRDSVPYVRGKYAFFLDRHAESNQHFQNVPSDSPYFLQAQYFIGANFVAMKELGKALDVYKKITESKAATDEEMRVVELSYMALGRLFYERDQPSKAVDSYLNLSRRSDLFDEALYEISWVYVKNKEFDKALRALELLALADPSSERLPDVRILEGNLRIRKAQKEDSEGNGDSKPHYDKAVELFESTRDIFRESHDELRRIIDERADTSAYLAQITGRTSKTFEVNATLPEVAASWLRQQPEVERIVVVENDLGQIESEIEEAEKTILRLEAAIDTPSKVNIFPGLAKKRFRSTELLEMNFKHQETLGRQERSLAGKVASSSEKARMEELRKKQQDLRDALARQPGAELSESDRIASARNKYDDLDKQAAEARTIIDVTEAQLVALENYVGGQGAELSAEERSAIDAEMKLMRETVTAMRNDLTEVRSDIVLAKDRAGTGDAHAEKREELRRQLRAAVKAEHEYLSTLASKMSSGDRAKMDQIARLSDQILRINKHLDGVNGTIDAIVDDALGEVRAVINEEKAHLVAYKREFANYEEESHNLGGDLLTLSFEVVTNKFQNILVRSDVGIVDVAWSLKEAAETTLARLNLDQARERRQLDSNFADVIREMREERAKQLFDQAAGK